MMTPERLAELEQVVEGLKGSWYSEARQAQMALAFNVLPELIAEVKRLQAEIEQLKENCEPDPFFNSHAAGAPMLPGFEG